MATKPFYGNPATDAPVFGKYAVLLSGLTSTVPTGTPAGVTLATMGFILNDGATVTAEWDPVGALDDDSPMNDGEESIDVTDHSAAGHGVYAKTYKNQAETITFTAKETTLRTLGIVYDASGLTDDGTTIEGDLNWRDPQKKYRVGLVRHNDTTLERKVTKNYAQIDNISRSFGDGAALRTVTMSIYRPADAGAPWSYYLGPKA